MAGQTPLLAPSLLTAPSSLTTSPTQSRHGPQARPASDGEGWGFQLHLYKDPRSMWGRSRTPHKQERPAQPEYSSGTKTAGETVYPGELASRLRQHTWAGECGVH